MTLHYNTVTPPLRATLELLMCASEFALFRVVGGTALSLQLGHRQSVDIDLFTDATYGTVDFQAIDNSLHAHFPYVDNLSIDIVGIGKSCYVGSSKDNCVKLDLFYTDPFIRPAFVSDNIRMAHVDDIAAMKIDVIARGGRKKDFWDIHELMNHYSLTQLLALHKERYPYTHDEKNILANFVQFDDADSDFDPICLHGKYWEVIKMDIVAMIP